LVSELLPKTFWSASDLNLGDKLTLTINSVEVEEVGPEKKPKPVMSFHDQPRKLILNRTNIERLSEAFGVDTDGWKNQKITLYVDPNVTFGGKRTPALRVKPIKPNGGSATELNDEIPF